MMDFQKKYKGVVTTGLWQTSQRYFRAANEILKSGVLGDVYKVQLWLCQSTNPRPSVEDSEAPSTLDYDMWLGPAPERLLIIPVFVLAWFLGLWWWPTD